MGMSATQARYLSLVAQQSNLEYQGQQINQERSVLAQQVSDLYNSLLNLQVPTPPSTQDFTSIVYNCNMLSQNLTFSASDVVPSENNTFTVNFKSKGYGETLSLNNGTISVERNTDEPVTGTIIDNHLSMQSLNGAFQEKADQSTPSAPGYQFMHIALYTTNPYDMLVDSTNHYVLLNIDGNEETANGDFTGDNEFLLATPENIQKVLDAGSSPVVIYELVTEGSSPILFTAGVDVLVESAETWQPVNIGTSFEDYYVVDVDGYATPANADDFDMDGGDYILKQGVKYLHEDGIGSDSASLDNPDTQNDDYLIGGKPAIALDEAVATGHLTEEQYNQYVKAIENANLKKSDGTPYGPDSFFFYKLDDGTIQFALKSDVLDNDGRTKTYNFIPNGDITNIDTREGCLLEFDPANGRITNISIPIYGDNGEIQSYTSINLEATTVTDEIGYENAMAEYKYEQYLYDQEQAKINAKTEAIQQMDRNLELKLQRLDTQRTQITTEMDALEKVLNDNIEKSYKTFSG